MGNLQRGINFCPILKKMYIKIQIFQKSINAFHNSFGQVLSRKKVLKNDKNTLPFPQPF